MSRNITYYLLILFVITTTALRAQTISEKRMRKDAEELFSYGAYRQALPLFKQLQAKHPEDVTINFSLGVCLFEYEKNYREALFYFQLAKQFAKENPPIELYYYIAKTFHLKKNWTQAIENYTKYLTFLGKKEETLKKEVQHRIEMCRNGAEICKQPNTTYQIDSLISINSEYGDYAPLITADESRLFFTSRKKNKLHSSLDYDGMPFEDIYLSTLNKNGEWQSPQLIQNNAINTETHDACIALSADGQYLYFYRSGKNAKTGNIYRIQFLGKNKWGKPEKITSVINTQYQENSLTITPDGQTIYFVSTRKGGLGKKDIYVTHLQPDSTWSEAQNLGNVINTEYDEDAPFIHPDGKTLYFSSTGHNSIGGYDIFKTVLQPDGSWSQPENLGCPLNTPNDDIHFVIAANGKHAYYASSGHKDSGREDIYRVTIQQPNIPLTMIRGTILCADSLKPLRVKIKVRDVESGELIKYVYKPNPQTGKYLIIIPPGKNYEMIVEANNYIPYKFNVFIPNQTEFYELYQTIYLKAVKTPTGQIGQGFSVDNTFFNQAGMLVDIKKQVEAEKQRQKQLQDLLFKIIETTDSLALNNLDEAVSENFEEEQLKTIGIDSTFESLLNMVDAVIETTDSLAMKNIDNLIERGFYTYAEQNIYFYGAGNLKDTLEVSTSDIHAFQPLNYSDTTIYSFGIGESNLVTIDSNRHTNNTIDSLILYYAINTYQLTEMQKEQLNTYLNLCKKYPKLQVSVTGYTDKQGSESYNLWLSQKRAQSVARWLKKQSNNSITVITHFKGETMAKFLNSATDRKVVIKLILPQ